MPGNGNRRHALAVWEGTLLPKPWTMDLKTVIAEIYEPAARLALVRPPETPQA